MKRTAKPPLPGVYQPINLVRPSLRKHQIKAEKMVRAIESKVDVDRVLGKHFHRASVLDVRLSMMIGLAEALQDQCNRYLLLLHGISPMPTASVKKSSARKPRSPRFEPY